MELLGWILSATTVSGSVLNAMKIKWGFIVWIVANFGWIYLNITGEFYEQIPVWVTLTIISIYGFIHWSRKEKEEARKNET